MGILWAGKNTHYQYLSSWEEKQWSPGKSCLPFSIHFVRLLPKSLRSSRGRYLSPVPNMMNCSSPLYLYVSPNPYEITGKDLELSLNRIFQNVFWNTSSLDALQIRIPWANKFRKCFFKMISWVLGIQWWTSHSVPELSRIMERDEVRKGRGGSCKVSQAVVKTLAFILIRTGSYRKV